MFALVFVYNLCFVFDSDIVLSDFEKKLSKLFSISLTFIGSVTVFRDQVKGEKSSKGRGVYLTRPKKRDSRNTEKLYYFSPSGLSDNQTLKAFPQN